MVCENLVVMLNSKLNFKAQIDMVIERANCILSFIKRQAKEFECPYVTSSLYCAFVRAVLEYCSIIWDPSLATHRIRICLEND